MRRLRRPVWLQIHLPIKVQRDFQNVIPAFVEYDPHLILVDITVFFLPLAAAVMYVIIYGVTAKAYYRIVSR